MAFGFLGAAFGATFLGATFLSGAFFTGFALAFATAGLEALATDLAFFTGLALATGFAFAFDGAFAGFVSNSWTTWTGGFGRWSTGPFTALQSWVRRFSRPSPL